jgi:predicted ATP-dependent serine protease
MCAAFCRPMLTEVQSLVCRTAFSPEGIKMAPKRTVEGFPYQRLALIAAVIEKRLHVSLSSRDIFVNVIGGNGQQRTAEPTCDLAVAISLLSSVSGCKIRKGWALCGEIGLRGELRGGQKQYEKQVVEARKLGFHGVIVPRTGRPSQVGPGRAETSSESKFQIARCGSLQEAVDRVVLGGYAAVKQALTSVNSRKSASRSHNLLNLAAQKFDYGNEDSSDDERE